MNYVGTIPLGPGNDCWDAAMYDAASLASRSAAAVIAVRSGVQKMTLAWDLRQLSNALSAFLDKVYVKSEAASRGEMTEELSEAITREQIESCIRSLEYMYETISRLHSKSERKGLTNNSLMAGSLKTIRRRSEELLDLADWLQTSLDYTPSELESIFVNARNELREGQVVSHG